MSGSGEGGAEFSGAAARRGTKMRRSWQACSNNVEFYGHVLSFILWSLARCSTHIEECDGDSKPAYFVECSYTLALSTSISLPTNQGPVLLW